ncbi:MAG: CehA/McbA family metallohydrolase [Paludibacter sp.]|nr:CehA/McbA family metallohydrolase [Paludibacter sp.]
MRILLLDLMFLLSITIHAASPSIGGYTVYYGHLHNHTNYSDGTGTPADAYNYAKNTAKLDFFGISDHDNYLDSLKWANTKIQADAFNQDGVFSTFYGFEWSYFGTYGHVTVVGTPDYTTVVATNTFENLKTWLSTRQGIAFFNHPGREDTNSKEFDHFTGTPSNKFVGIELWNKTEGFNSFYYNDGYTPNDNSKGYYEEALSLGWKIGAAGAGDDHLGTWGTGEDYRMAILSNNLTRADLWEAIQARRFYSTMDKNLALSFKINNQEMGSTLAPGASTFQVQASDADGEVFTNVNLYDKTHTLIQSWTPNATIVNVSTNLITSNGDFYYVKVTEADGGEAVSSPIWVVTPDTQAPSAFTATLGTVTHNSVELLLNATDNSGTVNYSITYGPVPTVINVTGTSAIQKSFFVTGLTPTTNYTFSVIAKDPSLNPAANNPVTIVANTTSPPLYTVTSSPVATVSPYLLANLTDSNPATSWKVSSPNVSFLTFEFPNAQVMNKVTLTSSSDNASRDPKSWFIKASNDTLAGWTVLNSQTNQSFATRELAKTYAFVNNVAYKFYRLHITESNYSTSSTMLGELAFGSDIQVPEKDTSAPTAFTATLGTVTQNSVELLLNATDNSGSVNYTVSYGNGPTVIIITGISATQKSCIVTGLNPGTSYTFSVIAKDAALNPAPNNPIAVVATTASAPTLKVTSSPAVPLPYLLSYLTDGNTTTSWKVSSPNVSFITFEYLNPQLMNKVTLTSSTDNASRDPKSWYVKASNDTLAGWTVLNSQTNQSFATRELAKTYSFVNNVAYKFYRLHITESNYSTSSTMLGELAFGSDIQVPELDTSAPTAFTATLGAVTQNSVEILLNATDNSGSVNYTVSYGAGPTVINTTGNSATQKSCVVTGLNPGTSYAFSVTAKDAAYNPAPNNPIAVVANTASASTLKVTSSPGVPLPYLLSYLTDGNTATSWKVSSPTVSYITLEYSNTQVNNKLVLTSSTDNASRDPKSWYVKASNDTLAGWTVLNSQTNQSFATRELAKTYSFVNNVAYKFYRLHITESNYSTSSTMLGELAFGSDVSAPLSNVKQEVLNDTLNQKFESPSEKTNIAAKQIKIYNSGRTLFVQNPSGNDGDLYLYDIYGRILLKQPFEHNTAKTLPLNFPPGLYLVIGVSLEEKVVKNIIIP